MSYMIQKAVEFDKLSAKFRKENGNVNNLWAYGWLAQPKYDGVMGIALMRGGGGRMLTRTGETVRSCAHILDELVEMACPNSDGYTLIGELWIPGESFPKISGMVRRHNPEPELCFVVHDILPYELETDEPYAQRLTTAQQLFGPCPWREQGKVLVTESLPYTGDINATAFALKAEGGFDGAMLKDPKAGYKVGLVKNGELVKVKPTLSLDLRVVEMTEAVGEKTGRPVYTITVEYNGVRSEVGSGMPHELPAGLVLGAIVEVEAMGVTADGKLREPRFKGVRFDKEQPDG